MTRGGNRQPLRLAYGKPPPLTQGRQDNLVVRLSVFVGVFVGGVVKWGYARQCRETKENTHYKVQRNAGEGIC